MLNRSQRAFTFVELIVVILIIGLLFALVGFQTGSFVYWREQGFIRRFSEVLQFLHNQAIADQTTYLLELDTAKNTYRVGVVKENETYAGLTALAGNVGILTLELTAILNPPIVNEYTFIPPPSFPSLAEVQPLPPGMLFKQIRTMRGPTEPGAKAYISFSPRGFSEFAVIQMAQSKGAPLTFLVNPFTGIVDIYHEYKDFAWTYGQNEKKGDD